MTEQHANHAAMRDDQDTPIGLCEENVVPCFEHARLKTRERLTAGWGMCIRISPEALQCLRVIGHEVGRAFAFPLAEVHLL